MWLARLRSSGKSRPPLPLGKILKALSITGTPITDLRNGLAKPRINIGAALNVVDRTTADDFDDDGKADLAVRRPSDNVWYFLRTSAGYTGFEYGVAGDLMAPADFDGDGKTDVAVFRPSTGTWFIKGSSAGFYTDGWGQAGDLPVPADYDGDGRADVAVYPAFERDLVFEEVFTGDLDHAVRYDGGQAADRGFRRRWEGRSGCYASEQQHLVFPADDGRVHGDHVGAGG